MSVNYFQILAKGSYTSAEAVAAAVDSITKSDILTVRTPQAVTHFSVAFCSGAGLPPTFEDGFSKWRIKDRENSTFITLDVVLTHV